MPTGEGSGNRLRPRSRAKLGQDAGDMSFDGANTDEKCRGNLPIWQTCNEKTEDLSFPGRKTTTRNSARRCWVLWKGERPNLCDRLGNRELLTGPPGRLNRIVRKRLTDGSLRPLMRGPIGHRETGVGVQLA